MPDDTHGDDQANETMANPPGSHNILLGVQPPA